MAGLKSIIVPVDGSELGNRAIPVAAVIAGITGASIEIVGVARFEEWDVSASEWVGEARRLLAPGVPVKEDVIVSASPVVVLLERARGSDRVLCLATHDRRPAAAVFLDSVGSQIVEYAGQPLLVVGPAGATSDLGRDVVVALDGQHDPTALLATAYAWAGMLGAPLRVVTVYEPVPPDVRSPEHYTRHHGPATDRVAYLENAIVGLERRLENPVDVVAIPDPVSVTDGLREHLEERPALMLVVGRPHGNPPLRPGVLHQLVQRVAVPLLVVPGLEQEPEGDVPAAERSQ